MEYLGGGSALDLVSITLDVDHLSSGLGCKDDSVYISVSLFSCMKKGPKYSL